MRRKKAADYIHKPEKTKIKEANAAAS